MFEVTGTVVGGVPIVEITCPIDSDHRLHPLSETEDHWECLDCGMTFEVKDAIQG